MVAAPKTPKTSETKAATPKKAPAKTAIAASSASPSAAAPHAPRPKREMVGIVVSDKMAKTIVVKVDRKVRHGQYFKYVVRSKKYAAHDEQGLAKMGDQVVVIESRPLSKTKRWALKKVLRKGSGALEINLA